MTDEVSRATGDEADLGDAGDAGATTGATADEGGDAPDDERSLQPDTRIVVDGVSKWFGDVVAVSEVSFTLGPGVTALLGPNGAGKSTIIRLLCGLTEPSQGTLRVLGGDPRRDLELRGRIGLVPQNETLFEDLAALEFVRMAAVLHRRPDPDQAARRAMAVVGLDDEDRRPIRTFSKGMRQRTKVAQAVVHQPDVIVLDEPLTGLDPQERRRLITFFHRLGQTGRCVVVSSHVLEEVERFGSRVLVMAQGRLAAEGDFHAIRELMDDRPHRVRIRSGRVRPLVTRLLGSGAVVGAHVEGESTALIDTVDAARTRRAPAGAAAHRGPRLEEVVPLDEDLESVFRYLVEGS